MHLYFFNCLKSFGNYVEIIKKRNPEGTFQMSQELLRYPLNRKILLVKLDVSGKLFFSKRIWEVRKFVGALQSLVISFKNK